jgi:hypothetical protein
MSTDRISNSGSHSPPNLPRRIPGWGAQPPAKPQSCQTCGVPFEHNAHRLDHCDQDCATIAGFRTRISAAVLGAEITVNLGRHLAGLPPDGENDA